MPDAPAALRNLLTSPRASRCAVALRWSRCINAAATSAASKLLDVLRAIESYTVT